MYQHAADTVEGITERLRGDAAGNPHPDEAVAIANAIHDAAHTIARQELASLGAHINSTHRLALAEMESVNEQRDLDESPSYQTARAIASFGGYLMGHYGHSAAGNPESEPAGGDLT